MNKAISLSVVAGLVSMAGVAWGQCSYASKQAKSDCGDKGAAVMTVNNNATGDIVQVASANGNFKTLVAAVQAAGLVDALKGPGPFTVFAPTDEAFAKLPKGTIENLLKPENKATLAAILTYHVVPGNVLAKDVKTGSVATLNGQRVDLKLGEGKVTIDNATVTATDVAATNGVIHVIDTVILPSDKSIVGTAIANGNFKTLARLLEAADLVGALEGTGPFTVFAPTDAAFAKLPKETLDSLLKPENKSKLAAILTYHVVPGRVFSDVAAKGATVTAADIDTTNGVIHVIDTVILPK